MKSKILIGLTVLAAIYAAMVYSVSKNYYRQTPQSPSVAAIFLTKFFSPASVLGDFFK